MLTGNHEQDPDNQGWGPTNGDKIGPKGYGSLVKRDSTPVSNDEFSSHLEELNRHHNKRPRLGVY